MANIDLFALTGSIAIQGDDVASRTITIGQTGTFDDVIVIDTATFTISSGGTVTATKIGILTDLTPSADGLTIQHGGVSIIVGADNVASTLTDATQKNARIGIPHYTNAEEPTNLLYANNTTSANVVSYGGGTSLFNAATEISFYTAPNTTTLTGTQRMLINGSGRVGINDATPDAMLDIVALPSIVGFRVELDATPTDAVIIVDSGAADIFRISATGEVSIGGVTPVTGTKLLLPSENDDATPTLAFGDGDTGFYEKSNDVIGITVGGAKRFLYQSNLAGADNVKGGYLQNLTASATIVTVGPRRDDTNTGLGGLSDDTLALLTAGATAILIGATQGVTMTPGASTDGLTITLDATPGDAIVVLDSGAADLFRVNGVGEVSIGGVTPVAGTKLLLPLENDPVTPTLAFGDGNTGFFEQADNILDIATDGAKRFIWSGNFYQSATANGPWIRNLNSTATEPGIGPDITETTTGMGSAGVDQISLITAALEAINISATQETTIQGTLSVSDAAEGNTAKLSRKTAHETHTLDTSTTSDTTTISIPSGARLLAVSFNVNTAVTNDGDDTWSADFITGSTTSLASAAAAAVDTKVDLMLPDEISTGVVEIQFTPQSGSFTAGIIEIVVYYEVLTSLANV